MFRPESHHHVTAQTPLFPLCQRGRGGLYGQLSEVHTAHGVKSSDRRNVTAAETLRLFLEQQPLLALFVVVRLGYALGGVNIRGFAGGPLVVGMILGRTGGWGWTMPLSASDRTDVVYAMTYPTGTITKILLLQVMLAIMGQP